ncbi:MAG: hypothetical protein ACXAEN_11895 [Candidatus Thorarchaeota archaeon]
MAWNRLGEPHDELVVIFVSNPMKRVSHGNPGIGATKSSAYVPLK